MPSRILRLVAPAILSLALPAQPASGSEAVLSADLGRATLPVFAFRPEHCRATGIVVVFPGYARDAATYRNAMEPLAQHLCAIVFAPVFDAERFPPRAYQRGGVTTDRASIGSAPVSLVPALLSWTGTQGGPTLPVVLLGHSAGGQFLSRVAAYVPNTSVAMIIADASTYVMPDIAVPAPYGGGFTTPDPAWLAFYLARPLTFVLGGADTGRTHRLVENRWAEAEGSDRLSRGRAVFAAGQKAAETTGDRLGWHEVIAPGLGHDVGPLFASAQMEAVVRAALMTPR